MINVLLVDDHEIVRRGLAALISQSGDVTVTAEAGSLAETLALSLDDVAVAVLDVRLPDGSGIELARSLREHHAELKIIMLTSFTDDEAHDAAVMAGAQGYLLKDIRGNQLVAAIRAVADGRTLISEETKVRAAQRAQRRLHDDERLASLSQQERRVLELLSEGLTNKEIGEQMFLAEKTVKNYVSNLLAKLEFSRRTEAALFAQRHLPHAEA